MTMRERVAWMATVTTIVIFGYYFWSVWADVATRTLDGDALFWRFLKCLGVAIAIMLPAALIGARLSGDQFDPPPDELERLIEARANRIGLAVLEVAIVGVVLASAWVSGLARTDFAADPAGATAIILVNLLLFVTASAALLREIVTIFQYRRLA
ncbi:hypothetical protein SAMN06295905_0240 [Devosia lucknowensis]|uniref:Uncharacterized protein n=1 Tax=Devosia lucknowensis TaxID=1096929 RepID=A0A1Y6EAA2_9HYPH|nr:hypothetical protein [Devosia lucknowensis]SMQ59504.1 hypothetical protein SAMN06295905_0240 [Devosia lucknowensis]